MSLRLAGGKRLQWIDTRRESGFSNFLFVDQEYASHPVMRRIFSLARKHGFQSVLIEALHEANCATLAEENAALAKRQPDFTGSSVRRLSFLRSLPDQPTSPGDFIGRTIFKSDAFSGLAQPRRHIYEELLPAPRGAAENNFIHQPQRAKIPRKNTPESRSGFGVYASPAV